MTLLKTGQRNTETKAEVLLTYFEENGHYKYILSGDCHFKYTNTAIICLSYKCWFGIENKKMIDTIEICRQPWLND